MIEQSTSRWSSEAKGLPAFLRVLGLVVAAVATYALAWLILPPSPAPLPAGATRLELRTAEPRIVSRLVLGCPAAAFPDMRVARDGPAMVFVAVSGAGGAEVAIGDGGRVDPIWPAGWSARLVGDRAELVSPEGLVVARDGDLIRSLGGGGGRVCLPIGSKPVVDPAR